MTLGIKEHSARYRAAWIHMRMTTSAKNQRQDVVGKRVQTLSQGILIDVEYQGDSTESLYVIMLSSHVFV